MNYTQFSYRSRTDAGRRLAKDIMHYHGRDAVIFAIPHGGIPVAVEIAMALKCDLDIIVARKIPIPFNTEAGYGAVTEDGMIVLNDPMVHELQLTREQIKHHVQKVMAEIRRRQEVFRKVVAPTSVTGKQALVVDDGLASGYTMVAAIKSMRKRGAESVVAAVPVSSASGWKLVRNEADEVVCPIVSSTYPFAVASFYEQWSDLTDEEVIESLDTLKNTARGHHD